MLDKTNNKKCFIQSRSSSSTSSNNSDLSFLQKKIQKNKKIFLNKNKVKNCVKKYTKNRKNKNKVEEGRGGGGSVLTTTTKSKKHLNKKKLLKYNILDKTANCDAHAKFKDFSIDYILK